MKPQTFARPRIIITTFLTVIGIGLFVFMGVKAVRQISDRQYIVGKQRTASGKSLTNNQATVSGAPNYKNGVTPVVAEAAKAVVNTPGTSPQTTKHPANSYGKNNDKKTSSEDTAQNTNSSITAFDKHQN